MTIVNRRSFLKILGATSIAAVSAPLLLPAQKIVAAPHAPLFVPSQNLDFGVPSGRLAESASLSNQQICDLWRKNNARATAQQSPGCIPMLLRQSEYLRSHGKLPAGSTVMVDEQTARRWIAKDIAVPGASAPRDMQMWSATRLAGRLQATTIRVNTGLNSEDLSFDAPILAEPRLLLNTGTPEANALTRSLERAVMKHRASGSTWFEDDPI